MEKEQFLSLVEKYLNNCATPDEKALIETYYNKMGEKKYSVLSPEQERNLKAKLIHKIEAEIWAVKKSTLVLPFKWMAAAAVLIIIGAGLFFLKSNKMKEPSPIDYASKILPGGNKAILILGDGTKIDLGKADKGHIADQTGQEIKKTAEGQLVYDEIASKTLPEISSVSFNTIITPNGGKFQIELSDGTKVWLNSASRIKYPSTFSKDSRVVELEGEGYFEVSHDSERPFIVKTGKQNVEVLGTHFNISAYNNDGITKTTLLEGSVIVSPKIKSHQTARLVPGQQSQLDGTELLVKNVDAESAIDWKNEKFIFRKENIKSIMRKFSRWYDIEVDYKGNVENLSFGGRVSRSKNLKEALKILTLTGDVTVKVEGRRVTIMP